MQPHSLATEPLFDPARYELLRALGEGGAGTVHLALDRETGEKLALKKLQRLDQKSVLRFKREFRALANLHHPNIIRLYDFGRGPDAWFLTMEYVDGLNLYEELRGARSTHETRSLGRVSANDQGVDAGFLERVTGLFQQLAAGVQTVHQAGMLHRDLKPSNVMVTRSGRVVVLDFGLVRELDSDAMGLTHDGAISGTPAYMSPEQALGQPLASSSDWYSFGVMLYEMLCGRLPIDGRNALDLIERKLQIEPEPLDDDEGPLELRRLCMALLQRDPALRPRGEEVAALLVGLSPTTVHFVTQTDELTTHTEGSSTLPLFGRDRELAQLRAALARTTLAETVVVHVRGTSGAGKSALVERFLAEPALSGGRDLLVLRSRCYEREAMPFKALDGVMDVLVADLLEFADMQVGHFLPAGVAELCQLFPVVERLPAARRLLAGRDKASGEAADVRRRAEEALSELFRRLATRLRLVVWVDDLQWGDLDSASVLKSWLSRLRGDGILLVFSYRSDEIETSPCLRLLLEPLPGNASDVFIDVAPLSDADVRELCRQRFSTTPAVPPRLVERIVDEAQGNPFLAQQLAALALAKLARGDADLDKLSMEQLVLRTSALLSPEPRELLNVLAIAGRPIAPHLALAAAEIRSEGRSHIHDLQALRLLRTREVGGQRWLEVYHDRVREGAQAALTAAEREQLQARLLRVLEAARLPDPDWLHELALGANQPAAALRYGYLAAERANTSLAFERAAELYARCLKLSDRPSEAADLWVKLALALTRCRRGAEAANAYLQASEHAEPYAQPRLLRLAASHLLRSGRFEEGERLVRRVLDLHGLKVPQTELGMMAAIGWERTRLAARGYELSARTPSEVTKALRGTAELYGTLAVDTQLYEPLRAVLFQSRSLRLALESGDAEMVARALCLTATLAGVSGTARAARHAAEILDRAEDLARRAASGDLSVELPSTRALCAAFFGRPLDVLEHAAEADRAYATKSSAGDHGDYFYLFAVHTTRLTALVELGRVHELSEALNDYLARAQATENRSAILQATLASAAIERMTNNCAGSRARLDLERAQLPRGSFGILHGLHMLATMGVACATADYDWALERLAEDWPAYLRAPIHRSAYLACVVHLTHARFLLNRHVVSGSSGDVSRLLRPDLHAIARLPAHPKRNFALFHLRGRCAYVGGDPASAVVLLQSSCKAMEEMSCADQPERERWALGRIAGGAEGTKLQEHAIAALVAIGVRDPLADLRGYYPELFAASAPAADRGA